MSMLRDKLDRAKAEYHAAQYPGDLASELLTVKLGPTGVESSVVSRREVKPDGSVRQRAWWIGSVGSAVAAGFFAATLVLSPKAGPQGGGTVPVVVQPVGSEMFAEPVADLRLSPTPRARQDVFPPVQQPGAFPSPVLVEGRSPAPGQGARAPFADMTREMTLQRNTPPENYTRP